MAEQEGTEGKVRRFWEEELGMDLSHLSGEDLRDFGERQARVETVDDLLDWDLTKAEEKAEAEHWEEWREKLAKHLGISRDALDTAESKVNTEMGREAISRFWADRGEE